MPLFTDPLNSTTPTSPWIGFEVTNADFTEFVEAGGYSNPGLWQHEFTEDGRVLTFEQAMARFEDRTGRPGPATWGVGSFFDPAPGRCRAGPLRGDRRDTRWRAPRPSKVFDEIEETPIGAASLGQVHAARPRDGREVVVKVQRPKSGAACRTPS